MIVNYTELQVGFIAGSVTLARTRTVQRIQARAAVLADGQRQAPEPHDAVHGDCARHLGPAVIVREDTGINSALSPYVDADEADIVGKHVRSSNAR